MLIYAPLIGLAIFILILYSPEITSMHIPALSEVGFEQKTDLVLTFSIAIFAAIEGYAMYMRFKMEENQHQVSDARNELEKAYGPLYTILNKVSPVGKGKNDFWLEYEDRRKIDEIMATYPFMFSQQVYSFWQEKIRNPQTLIKDSNLDPLGGSIDMKVYVELGSLINEEYAQRVKKYHKLIEKPA
jgi:hypothetical protein